MPGTAALASTASTSAPAVNQCSAALSIEAATHSKRTGRSSISGIGRASVIVARSASLPCRCVPRAGERGQPVQERAAEHVGALDVRPGLLQTLDHRDVGSLATAAPLIAPTLVPTTRSGVTSRSSSARSIPTSLAPS